ncbi:MAG TPA: hypothetical protein VIV58_20670 [Kofleriaceae bacterium]
MSITLRFSIFLTLAACGSSPGAVDGGAAADASHAPDAAGSMFHPLPFAGGPDAPVVASAEYRCRALAYNAVVEMELVVTDPQGPADLAQYTADHVGMFTADPPSGPEVVLGFSVKSFGLQWERTYDGGTQSWGAFLYQQDTVATAFNAICAASTWPIDVLAVDNNGHVTTGLVRATRVADPL